VLFSCATQPFVHLVVLERHLAQLDRMEAAQPRR
jgi:hypothetical protein